MPKLKDLYITVRDDEQRELKHTGQYPFSVDSEGTFKALIPEEIVQPIEKIAAKQPKSEPVRCLQQYQRGGGQKWVLLASNKSWIEAVLTEYGRQQLKSDTTTELRIFFNHKAEANFWINPDGSIAPNGEGEDPHGQWSGDEHHRRYGWGDKAFSIGLGARVVKVTTTTTADGTTTTTADGTAFYNYEAIGDKTEGLGDQGRLLNRFVAMPFPHESRGQKTSMNSVPYTEANAVFFVNAILTLCQLTQRFEAFFGAENVAELIAATPGNLMLPSPAPTVEPDIDDDL